jgi:predicted acetyltransferase
MTAASASSVSLTEGRVKDAPVIQNLVQLYTHDFSELWAGTARGDLRPEGKFDPYPLDEYWSRPNWSAWLIWRGAALAGFALLNDQSHSGLPTTHNVAEFFILRKYRGQGAGRIAAQALFSRYPGQWEAAIARKNVAAHKFWRSIIEGAPQASARQELDVRSDQWNGPVLRFEWREN